MKNNKLHIAIVAPWFPPQKGVAVNRIASFAKYLKTDKTEISVFTIAENNKESSQSSGSFDVHYLKNNAFIKFI